MEKHNIFADIPEKIKEELFEDILPGTDIKLERIVSEGQVTPEGEWLIQGKNEWVMVLKGYGEILFEDGKVPIKMHPGDHILIKKGQRHRVVKTDTMNKTVWLVLHF